MAFSTFFLLLNVIFFPLLSQSLQPSPNQTTINPFSPKASLLRHWKTNFPGTPMPQFLLVKASPLNTTELAAFSHCIDIHTLQNHIHSFCIAGNLFCDMKVRPNLTHDVTGDADFESYSSKAFLRDQKSAESSIESFKNDSIGENHSAQIFTGYGPSWTYYQYWTYNRFRKHTENTNVASTGFRNYAADSNGQLTDFSSYGNGTYSATQDFTEYGKDRDDQNSASLKIYGSNATFKGYFKSQTTFQEYANSTAGISPREKLYGEPGKFFRQVNLMTGKIIPIPDIRDKMPKRSFLPRVLADKLPFSSSKLPELVEVLDASGLTAVMAKTISECERKAVKDETKRCVTSIEGMTEFAVSVLGKTASVSTTASTNGSGNVLLVGKVDARNVGKETRAVSCHQSLFPYLVYYCHMVPRVMVYDVELLDVKSRKMVNKGVAICHLDTTQWRATHVAFLSLGGKPGKIEVCHWIYENDLIWVSRD